MRELIVKEKSGFLNTLDQVIKIFNADGSIFYDTSKLKRQPKKFNLPTGNYKTENILKKTTPRIFYCKLPKPERNLKKPNNFEIVFGENPNKCTVFHDKNLILFDNKFKDNPMIDLLAIYYHEVGHKFYETEWKCDKYSMRELLRLGYNPSQIKKSFHDTLSNTPSTLHRKLKYFDYDTTD